MTESLQTVGYLTAAILFILSIGGLSHQKTAKIGNLAGIVGMIIALVVTFGAQSDMAYGWSAAAIAVGGAVGVTAALRVAMRSLPELVAMFNSFVGLSAALVGISKFLTEVEVASSFLLTEVYIGVAIGALTFTGSTIAWGKLAGRISGKPLMLPMRHLLNVGLLVGLVALAVPYVAYSQTAASTSLYLLLGNCLISGLLGFHLVLAIGGADMPVVVSVLNSFSGWASAATGFLLGNDLLIITGALVGSSGAILSYVMARGMNRPLANVVLGGFGTAGGGGESEAASGDATSTDAGEVAGLLERAERVVIVPGYGMAVAQAQHAISRLTERLRNADTDVRFGIHPVAGRMPGHMNVLLAEADIPYDIVEELEAINPKLASTDVVLVVGANDTVNPVALEDESSPIYGMPQVTVWEASNVIVLKRSLSPGYAGVPNPLFYRENTKMFFGDAKESVEKLLDEL